MTHLSIGNDDYPERADSDFGRYTKTTTCANCNKTVLQATTYKSDDEHFCDRDCFRAYPFHE